MLPKFLALIFATLLTSKSLALNPRLDLQLGYHAMSTLPNRVTQTALYSRTLFPWVDGEFGVRLGESAFDLNHFDYKGELTWRALSFFSVTGRLSQSNRLTDSMSVTQALIRGQLDVWPFDFMGFFVSFGWYKRFHSLTKLTILPTFSGAFYDTDMAASIGLRIQPTALIATVIDLSTIEEIDIFNLANPFLRIRAAYEPKPGGLKWTAFARYRILLGFGRLDEFMMGLGCEIPLEPKELSEAHS
ncbi:MAG: hypothetical protein HY537_16325 [Deltaproteobacteria bacterium]|nr:hypothetical protein [Deltaproteobacteria bacterium]